MPRFAVTWGSPKRRVREVWEPETFAEQEDPWEHMPPDAIAIDWLAEQDADGNVVVTGFEYGWKEYAAHGGERSYRSVLVEEKVVHTYLARDKPVVEPLRPRKE